MNILGVFSWVLSGALIRGQQCNRRQYVQPDSDDVFTYRYRGPWSYTWCFETARGYVVTLNCPEVQMTKFTDHCRDTLDVTITGHQGSQVYCDPFQVRGSGINMKLFSSDGLGNFKCYFKSRRATDCECGYTGDSRLKITQGTPTGLHEFPSMAGLIDAQARYLKCGAVLIHERLALTAAHCVVDQETLQILNSANYGLLVGAHRISQVGNTSSANLYKIRRFVPNFNFKNKGLYDIALIETTITMWFGRNVGPACLPYKFSYHLYHEDVIIAGWGHTEFGGSESDVLLKGTVTIQYPKPCENIYSGSFSRETMICSLDSGTDQCQHDSGGPVYYIDPGTQLYFILGITNGGIGCGGESPSVSARVFSYLEWISTNYPGAEFCLVP